MLLIHGPEVRLADHDIVLGSTRSTNAGSGGCADLPHGLRTPWWQELSAEPFLGSGQARLAIRTAGLADADQQIIGTALVLYRVLPGTRRSFAYLPEGPDLDWCDARLERWLTPLVDHLARPAPSQYGWSTTAAAPLVCGNAQGGSGSDASDRDVLPDLGGASRVVGE